MPTASATVLRLAKKSRRNQALKSAKLHTVNATDSALLSGPWNQFNLYEKNERFFMGFEKNDAVDGSCLHVSGRVCARGRLLFASF